MRLEDLGPFPATLCVVISGAEGLKISHCKSLFLTGMIVSAEDRADIIPPIFPSMRGESLANSRSIILAATLALATSPRGFALVNRAPAISLTPPRLFGNIANESLD